MAKKKTSEDIETTAAESKTETTTEATGEVKTEKESKVKMVEPKFTLEKLQANCRAVFGVSICTFAGATAGLSGTYTINEMKEIINNWLKKEVK